MEKVHKVLKYMALFLPLKKLTAPASDSDVTWILSSYNLSGTSSGWSRASQEGLSTHRGVTGLNLERKNGRYCSDSAVGEQGGPKGSEASMFQGAYLGVCFRLTHIKS